LLKSKLAEIVNANGSNIIQLQYYSSHYKLIKSFDFNIGENSIQVYHQNATHSIVTTNEIDSLSTIASTLKVELKYIITNVYKKILTKLMDYQENIDTISNLVSCIDVVCSKSYIAKKYNLCKPKIIADAPKSFLNATQMRHILIEYLQNDEIYVGNNIVLGNEKQDGILLFGTNAVGKTCFMKSVGISVIMAQAGLFVPCTSFVYKPYENIFTRINRNDNMFKGLSTFAVEISELRLILNNSNENSLILADELCSGTEYSSAISIFVSTLQELHKRKSSFIFTTHLHPIIYFDEVTALSTIHAKHMEVVYDKEKDVLVYNRKIVDGGGSNMYGLEVSKSLRLPEEFLENAFQIRAKYFSENASVLANKTSRYNKDKILGICELCMKNPGTEIHHLTYQKDANETGMIIKDDGTVFHKNNLANLVSICENCHENIHHQNLVLEKVKTTQGYKIIAKQNNDKNIFTS
jgi:DNA mismatch repair protein MutS